MELYTPSTKRLIFAIIIYRSGRGSEVRAPGSGPGGRRFKSSRPDQGKYYLGVAGNVPNVVLGAATRNRRNLLSITCAPLKSSQRAVNVPSLSGRK